MSKLRSGLLSVSKHTHMLSPIASRLLFPLQISTATNTRLESSMSKINKQNTLNSGYSTVNDLWFFAGLLLLSSSTPPACSNSLFFVLTALAQRTCIFCICLGFSLSSSFSLFTIASSGSPHISTSFRTKRELMLETCFSVKISLKHISGNLFKQVTFPGFPSHNLTFSLYQSAVKVPVLHHTQLGYPL